MAELVYVAKVGVVQQRSTLREVRLPAADEPLSVGFHDEIATFYGIPEGKYDPATTTYDVLVASAVG